MNNIKLTVLAENYVPTSIGLKGEHGFSVLIQKNNKTYLFDTGQFGTCVDNALTLGCDLREIEKIFLSHGHYDHCGGLEAVVKSIGHPVEVIGHSSIYDKKYAVTKDHGTRFIGIKTDRTYLESTLDAKFNFQDGFYKVDDGVWLTGEVPFSNEFESIPDYLQVEHNGKMSKDTFVDDNSVVIDTGKGLLVIFGCAHRGMVNILSYIKKILGKNIYGIVGGTHLFNAKLEHIEFVKQFIKKEDIKLFAPAHCTGIKNIIDFTKDFPEITKPAFCGTVFEIF